MAATERMSLGAFRDLAVKKAKYSNARHVVDGQKFDSKLEADRYVDLRTLREQGIVKWFTRQVPFHLPGGIVYRADFMVVWNEDGRAGRREVNAAEWPVSVEDCKGYATRVSINKIKTVEALYGFKVHIITKETRLWTTRSGPARK